jgi:hypothetical protein
MWENNETSKINIKNKNINTTHYAVHGVAQGGWLV